MGQIIRHTCNCYGCRRKLSTFEAAWNGICNYHLRYLLHDDYWAGVCWNCGNITAIGPRFEDTRKGKVFVVKDKYIFAKGCKHCMNDEEKNIAWMTIKKETPPTSYVTPDGKIVPIKPSENQLKSGFPKPQISLRDVKLGFEWNE